jgi:hypothetical protein
MEQVLSGALERKALSVLEIEGQLMKTFFAK